MSETSQDTRTAEFVEHQTPGIEDNLALLDRNLERLESEADALAGTNQYPDWWYQDGVQINSIVPQLQDESTDPAYISQYYDLFKREHAMRKKMSGYDINEPIEQFIFNLGNDATGRGLKAEAAGGSLRTAIVDSIKNSNDNRGNIITQLDALRTSYGLESATELLGLSDDDYSRNVRKLLTHPNSIKQLRHMDEDFDYDMSWEEHQASAHAWMTAALRVVTGIESKEASDYTFSASKNSESISTPDFVDILAKFDHFGADRLRRISKATGIHGIEAYSQEQLERMEAFPNDPKSEAARLDNHDVNVVMVNRAGDYNGIMRNVAADYDDEKGRTLFFEITEMGDIYRHIIKLHKAGIKPSSLILAAHSGPGRFIVADERVRGKEKASKAVVAGRKIVEMTAENPDKEGSTLYSMHGMKGVAKLVDKYMQPSRGIDDAVGDSGRKKIIFQACDAGTKIEMKDLNDKGQEMQIGVDSVISRLGRDLMEAGIDQVDVYGAAAGLQMHRTNKGVRYSGQPEDKVTHARVPLKAERIRIQNGQLIEQQVEEITLRR